MQFIEDRETETEKAEFNDIQLRESQLKTMAGTKKNETRCEDNKAKPEE